MTRLRFLALFILIVSGQASAFDLGIIGGARQDSFSTDSTTQTYSTNTGYGYGALLFLELNPLVYFRTGLISKTRQINGTTQIFGTSIQFTSKDNIFDFPLDLQIDFPGGIYIFGGALYSSTQSTSCSVSTPGYTCQTQKTNDDLPINAGLGFNFINNPFVKLGIEGEYQAGTRNLSSTGPYSTWYHAYGANAVLRLSL